MDARHTPGPWIVEHGKRGIMGDAASMSDVLLIQAYGPVIIKSQGVRAVKTVAEVGHDEHVNARLIAAAPELLEALECMVSDRDLRLSGYVGGVGRGRIYQCIHCRLQQLESELAQFSRCENPHCKTVKARAAIAKAKGQS